MNDTERRRKLEKIFFSLAKNLAEGEASARDILESFYPRADRSTKPLTIDQLAHVVREVASAGGKKVDLRWLYPNQRDLASPTKNDKPMTGRQFFRIVVTAGEKGIGNTHLANLMKRFCGGLEGNVTSLAASNLINYLDKMQAPTQANTNPQPTGSRRQRLGDDPLVESARKFVQKLTYRHYHDQGMIYRTPDDPGDPGSPKGKK